MLRVEFDHRVGSLSLEVAFTVPAGRCLALAGPSGAGKTTVLRLIAGTLHPARGRIERDGRVWVDTERSVWTSPEERGCGYVFQDYALFPHLSAWRNVAYGLRRRPRPQRREIAFALLDRFGLADRAHARPATLSGGERQRVAIARAVVGGRELLLADEPSGALDSTNAEAVMRLILAACHRGMAAVVVTHDAQLASWADRVIFLRDGRIVDQTLPVDSPEAILAHLPNQ